MRGLCECLLLLLLLLLCLQGICSALQCDVIPGKLAQIDAGNGQVFGVNSAGQVYTLYGSTWAQVPGALTHVTVGPAGVWGVNRNHNIYRMVGGNWTQTTGSLKQIDAGGSQFVAGIDKNNVIYSLCRSSTILVDGSSPLPWDYIQGNLKYYSCGPLGCWAVSPTDTIYYREDITPRFCVGSRWQHVSGSLSMIEVGTDGSVYGADSAGRIYRRGGITACNLVGTHWDKISMTGKITHVTYDLDILWALSSDGKIQKCRVSTSL